MRPGAAIIIRTIVIIGAIVIIRTKIIAGTVMTMGGTTIPVSDC